MLRFGHAFPFSAPSPRPLLVLAAIGAFLSGCGFARFEQREPWRAEAEAACMRAGIIRESSYIRPTKPIDGPGPCGADLPLKVAAFENDARAVAMAFAGSGQQANLSGAMLQVTMLKPEATLGCPMVAWTDDWIATQVQPAAIAWFGQGVKEIRTGGSYACRRRNHRANAKLSEHAFGNAIDIMSFVLNDGNIVTVKGGWRGTEQEQGFLRDVLHGACQRFKTVLGPGSDALHYDHFHLDLAHHDARGTRRYCKPQVAAPQRPLPGTYGPGVSPFGGPANPYAFSQPPQLPAQAPTSLAARTPLPPASGGILPQNAGQTGAPREDYEVEPEFDPGQFDLPTGSIRDLPAPRQSLPGLPPARVEDAPPAPKPAQRRAAPPPRKQPAMSNPAGG